MIVELVRIFACLAAGELLCRTGILPFPGSVLGLIFLYTNLMMLGHVPKELATLADSVLSVLGMLFVPAGVGVLAYLDLLRTEFAPIVTAVVIGTIITLGVTGFVANLMARGQARNQVLQSPEATDASI